MAAGGGISVSGNAAAYENQNENQRNNGGQGNINDSKAIGAIANHESVLSMGAQLAVSRRSGGAAKTAKSISLCASFFIERRNTLEMTMADGVISMKWRNSSGCAAAAAIMASKRRGGNIGGSVMA